MGIFPNVPLDEVLRRTAEHWDMDGAYPVPRGDWLRCPVCGSADAQGRAWRYHRPQHAVTTPYRCDVTFKCTQCACVWLHGIAVTQEHWHAHRRTSGHIRWRNVLRDLEAGGA